MSQVIKQKVKGLFTSFNQLSEVPEGALLVADNIDIIQDSVAQPRRGFDRETGAYSNASHRTDALTEYQSKKIAHHGATIGSATVLSYLSSGTWTSIETVSAVSGRRMKFAGLNQNLYYTTSTGLRTIDSYNGTARAAGAAKGLDLTASTSASGSTWLANGEAVAFRAVWVYKDANKNLIFGAPSQREIYTNSSGSTKAVDVVVTIPSSITTSWFVQLYRSAAVTAGTEPSDELGLVYEAYPTAGEITAKSLTITDVVPEELRGATIYTAASQEGLAFQNEQPPLANDIDSFRGCLFFGGTTSKHRYSLSLLAVGASLGIVNDDTITIGGITYTGKASETVASAQFKVDTAGTASEDIANTARSLVRVINRHTSSTVYAYYVSGVDDLPGKILLEERAVGGAAFYVTSSRATCWSPTGIPTSGTTQASSNDSFSNGLFWSKPDQHEAVPLPNFVLIGSKNSAITRIKALRDALFVFKADGQVYKVSGYYPSFQVDKIEDSVKVIGAETVVVLNNQIYALSEQGVIVISDSTKVVSRPIEQELLSLVNQNYALTQTSAFGVAYESDRKYYIYLPSSSADAYATQAYVYNIFTNTWVRHTVPATCAFIDSSNNFYLGDPTSQYLRKERRNYDFRDYVDYGFSTEITASSSGVVTLDSGTDDVDVGDLLYQSDALYAVVSAVNSITQQVTLEADPGLTVADVVVLKAIATQVTWIPSTLDNPAVQKQIHTVSLIFQENFIGTASLTFISDINPTPTAVPVVGYGLGAWGLFAWGEEAWGAPTTRRPVRQWVPLSMQRCAELTVSFSHTWSYSPWLLTGLSVIGELTTESTGE